MRAAEVAAIANGVSVDTLMARAGAGVAAWAARLRGGHDVLVLAGPGNNGGDGYVAACLLARAGVAVRIAALGEPMTEAARRARGAWAGPVEQLAGVEPAPVLIDAAFGTGLSRALDETTAVILCRLAEAARMTIAVDLPSGIDADRAAPLGRVPRADVTLALGAIKPAHLLEPAAGLCGTVRLVDIGVAVPDTARVTQPPGLGAPGAGAHKYSRGMVAVVGGAMPGAGALAAEAALRGGAGYALLLGGAGGPAALVHRPYDRALLVDARLGAIVIGPGLGRDAGARARVADALAAPAPLVIDGDALHLVTPQVLRARAAPTVLTPHGGEFVALFGEGEGNKIDRAVAAAARSGAILVFKGADTVIAAPDGRVRVHRSPCGWLASAGTGDVLAGAIAAQLAGGLEPVDAAEAGVWLHGDAARRLGGAFIADDLVRALSAARATR